MRELVLRVPRRAVEDVLDRLLPMVPGGVREVPAGRHVELRLRGQELPSEEEIKRAAGPWPHKLSEREVSDDWRRRRVEDYEPDLIAGRMVVRPEWAPVSPTAEIEIVLGEDPVFGSGGHPTTRTCLEQLMKTGPAGSFADLGCGTGVLAITAAKLGYAPVVAIDADPRAVRAASENAQRNGVDIDTRLADLSDKPPPQADVLSANVPAAVHEALAHTLPKPVPGTALLSGFGPELADQVVSVYSHRGLAESERIERRGWSVVVLSRD